MPVCKRGGRLEAGGPDSARRYAGEGAAEGAKAAEVKEKLGSESGSQDCKGVSGESVSKSPSFNECWGDIFLFFEEDVLTVSCVCSSRMFGGGGRCGDAAAKDRTCISNSKCCRGVGVDLGCGDDAGVQSEADVKVAGCEWRATNRYLSQDPRVWDGLWITLTLD